MNEFSQNSRNTVKVGSYTVDLDSLLALRHQCDPTLCINTGCCCNDHTVIVTDRELTQIQSVLPVLPKHGCAEMTDIQTRQIWTGQCALEDVDGKPCPFAYTGPKGETLCALHTFALSEGLSPAEIKPAGCILWPLSLSDNKNGELSVQPGAYKYLCNARRPENVCELDSGVKEIVGLYFGKDFLRAIQKALSRPRDK